MAVRNESVRISAIDDFTSPVARMSAAAALFKRQLDDINGTNVDVNRGLIDTARSVNTVGDSTRRTSADINQFSGRLRIMADAALTLGPATLPIAAIAVPAITGLASAFGFAAIGAGSAIVAFQGVGDALSAVNKAQLEPTAANLAAARQAMDQISAPAREFVRELNGMDAAFTAVRDAAAEGFFSQLTPALADVEAALPRVASLFESVAGAVGKVGAEAIESLTGPEWADFFSFIQAEAPRALSDLGAAVGSVAHGMAELWMAFSPLNRDFNGWLRDAAAGFDKWAQGLSQTEGFQEFVDYIRTSGPQVAEAFAAIGNAVLQVVQAISPLGGPVLQVITQFANALATLADSDLGTPLFATAAGLAAVGRAGRLLGVTSTGVAGLVGSLRQLALVGVFVGAVKGIQTLDDALQSLFNRDIDQSKLPESISALASGRVPDDLEKMTGHLKNLDAAFLGLQDKAFGWLPGSTAVEEATDEIGKLDEQLAHLVESGQGDTAAAAFETIQAEAEKAGVSTDTVRESFEQYLAAVDNAAPRGAGLREFFTGGAEAAQEMTSSVQSLSDALAGLSGWLDRREALQGFQEAMRALNESIAGGKSGEWAANVNAVGRSLVQVASTLQGGARFKFIDDSISQLREMANDAGPKAQAEVRGLINQLRKLSGTKGEPKVGVRDEEFRAKVGANERRLRALAALEAHPNLDLNDADFQRRFGLTKKDLAFLNAYMASPAARLEGDVAGQIASVRNALNALNGQTSTVYINTVRTVRDVGAGRPQIGGVTKAEGGLITGPGTTTSDSIPAWLSNREYVVRAAAVDHYGVDFLHNLNAMRLAGGGQVVAQPTSGTTRVSVNTATGPLVVSGTLQTPWGPTTIEGIAREVARAEIGAERRHQRRLDRD